MFDAIGTVLAWFYDLTNNYGLAIMLLTLGIMLVLTPLTLKGTRSMIAMQRLQPEMKKIQNRYKDDRQKLNEEMMKFYKENSINPVGGCLPLVLQMPVFFVLYRVLYGLTNPAPYAQDMGRAFGLAAKNPAAKLADFGTFQPNHLDKSSQMYKDLAGAREMKSFGIDLATSAQHVLSNNLAKGLPYLVLIMIIGVTAWYQQKQIQGRNPQMQQQINPQQQMLMKIMPYFLPLISFTLPAGVILYFVVSNLFRIGQQGFITRTMYHDANGSMLSTTAVDTTSTSPVERKGMFAQLKEVIANSGPPPPPKGAKGQGRANLAKGAKGATVKGSAAKGNAPKGSAAKGNAAKNNAARRSTTTAKAAAGRNGATKAGSSRTGAQPAPTSNARSKPAPSKPAPSKPAPSKPPTDGAKPPRGAPRPEVDIVDPPAPAATESPMAAPDGRDPVAPSRSAPIPGPNRSQSRKKRR